MDWTISIVTFIIGAIIGYFISRIQASGDNSADAQQAKNQQLQAELEQYKQDVEQHFSSSADLLNQLATDYSKIYQHMSQSQQALLPDSEPSIAALSLEDKAAVSDSPEQSEPEPALEASFDDNSQSQQPNDYVQGTHGIISQTQSDLPPEKSA